ncbi:MAG: site-specific integrase [Muribaculum sp.]|nr:site-specific integrase [Muribaculum sp.]
MKDSFFVLTFFIRKPKAKGDGEYPIYARITAAGQSIEFTIGRKVNPDDWDQRRQRTTGRSRRDIELAKYLEMVRTRFNEIHTKLMLEGRYINPRILKDHYFGNVEKPKMLCDVFREANIKRKEELERGDICAATYGRWERCVTYLEDFMTIKFGQKDIPIKDVTTGFTQDFEHYLRVSKNCANNTTVRYLRYLKNVIQYAIANKWVSEDPFIGRRFKRTVAQREFLTEPELHAIMELNLGGFPRLENVRDAFVFCCFTGLAFTDIKSLKSSDISTDSEGKMWIRKPRNKTGEMSVIPMLEIPVKLMLKYAGHPAVKTTGQVIPVISNQRMNAYLSEIATLAKVQKHLTTHIARHTFATMSINNHVPIETISKMLGHSDIKTTLIYAKLQNTAIYEDMENMRTKFDGSRMGI